MGTRQDLEAIWPRLISVFLQTDLVNLAGRLLLSPSMASSHNTPLGFHKNPELCKSSAPLCSLLS